MVAGLGFVNSISRAEGLVSELGLLVTEGGGFGRLSPEVQAAIRAAPSLLHRLLRFGEFVAVESSNLRMGISIEGETARVSLNLQGLLVPGRQFSEWLQLDSLIGVVSDLLGSDWSPDEITFMSAFRLPPGLFERYPDTVVRCGQPQTSITLPAELLSAGMPTTGLATPVDGLNYAQIGLKIAPVGFEQALKRVLRPYLADGYPSIGDVALAAGMSARTLQRRLKAAGLNYRNLVRAEHIRAAADLLLAGDSTILQAAYSVGYSDPSNFARAYRRVTGSSPRRRNGGA